MSVFNEEILLNTVIEESMFDITENVAAVLRRSNLSAGIACVFNPGSTGTITTIEFEPGLLIDFPTAMKRLFPRDIPYEHERRWHDGNGHSHIRASMVGPGLSVPFIDGKLTLGPWQQIVFIEFDNKPHRRTIQVQLVGE